MLLEHADVCVLALALNELCIHILMMKMMETLCQRARAHTCMHARVRRFRKPRPCHAVRVLYNQDGTLQWGTTRGRALAMARSLAFSVKLFGDPQTHARTHAHTASQTFPAHPASEFLGLSSRA